MPPKLTPEQRIESDKRKAEYMVQWKIRNKEKFDTYMRNYYVENKQVMNRNRTVNSQKQRLLAKEQKNAQNTENNA